MKVNHIGYYAFCNNCNTEITEIQYNELLPEVKVETIEVCYEKKQIEVHQIECPICGQILKANLHRKEK